MSDKTVKAIKRREDARLAPEKPKQTTPKAVVSKPPA